MSRFDEGMPVLAIEDESIRWSRSFHCLFWSFSVLFGKVWNNGETPGLESRLHMDGHILDVLCHRYLCSDEFAWFRSALDREDNERMTDLKRETRMLSPFQPSWYLMFMGMSTSETWPCCMRQTSCAQIRSSDACCAVVRPFVFTALESIAGIAAYQLEFLSRFKR